MTFDPDKALEIARRSVHAFWADKESPHADPCKEPDNIYIRLLTVKDEEVDELLENNCYD